MSACELCGHDPVLESEIAEAVVESAEIEAAGEVAAAEEYAESREEDREHVESLAEIHEAAETERTEIAAAAAVQIAEAQAEAAVAIAETAVEPAGEDEDQDHEDAGEEPGEGEEVADDAGSVTPVEVPPQVDDGEPAQRSDPNAGTAPRRRRRGPAFGRRSRR